MKKVLLINPPLNYFPGLKGKDTNYCRPPLGIAYLASYLQKYYPQEIKVKILDAMVLDLTKEEIIKEIKDFNPNLIGITSVTATATFVKGLSEEIKRLFPQVIIVVGGPHPTALPFDLLPPADISVIREGEETLLEILKRGEEENWEKIKGISFLREKEQKITPSRPFIQDLDSIPFPARHLLPLDSYFHLYPYKTRTKRFTTIFTARGCPFACRFCGNEYIWKRQVRYRRIEAVLEEIKEVVKRYNVSLIFFDDDTFTINKERAYQICAGIIDLNLNFKWICHSRADILEKPLLEVMKRAGCVEMQVGIESGDQNVLDAVNKSSSLDKLREGMRALKEVGIQTWGTFMLGNISETKETIKKTIKFALELDPTYASFIVFLPFPGLSIYDEYVQKGYIKTFRWEKYCWHGEPVFETEELSKRDLISLRREANIKFYLRPHKLMNYLFTVIKIRSLREMWRNFRAFLNVILPKPQGNRQF